jgi:hypothetical protein
MSHQEFFKNVVHRNVNTRMLVREVSVPKYHQLKLCTDHTFFKNFITRVLYTIIIMKYHEVLETLILRSKKFVSKESSKLFKPSTTTT